jgi:flagellar hook-associated protein 1 FlgK
MSINLYQTGVSGLLTAQQQLATTGHNITNVNSEGYNRQRVEQGVVNGNYNGNQFIGSGTYVQDITRIYDQFSYKEQLLNQSNLGHANSINIDLDQLNQIMSVSSQAIDSTLTNFYQTINSISDQPSDTGLRNIAISQAKILASNFNQINDNLDQLESSTNNEIQQIANTISQIATELANINDQILQNNDVSTSGQPNDLLDKRDQLVTELGQYTTVNTVKDVNGVMTVIIGNGTTLVTGTTPLTLSAQAGDPDGKQTQIQLNGPNSSLILDASKLGGALAAKFEFRDEHVGQARSELNRLAMALSSTMNDMQAQGLDLNARQGEPLFTDINTDLMQQTRVLGLNANTGTLDARVVITDVSIVPTDAFEIKYDGTDYQLTNLTTGNIDTLVETSPGSGSYATNYGFEFNEESGLPATGDTFVIRPTENSAALMQVALTDSAGIAASSAIAVTSDQNNVSNGAVNIVNIASPEAARTYTSTTNQDLVVDVYESAPGTFDYRIYDAATPPPVPPIASGTFPSGTTAFIDMPPSPASAAFQIEISGLPVGDGPLAREKFTIADAFGSGNGSNASLMAATEQQNIINNAGQTFAQSLTTATTRVGANASAAESVADTAQALFTQAYNRNQAKSGVNLDEEAANLLKFQQAYQAASQIISVANTIFDTLLAASR